MSGVRSALIRDRSSQKLSTFAPSSKIPGADDAQLMNHIDQMQALHRASLSLFSDLSLDGILTRIVRAAKELASAKYAALGVPDDKGGMARFISEGLSEEERARIGDPPQGSGLLGEMLRTESSLRLADLSQHPSAIGFPDGHPKMTSFLGVPIIGFGRPLGQIYLTERQGADEFSEADQQLVEMLVPYAASAIEVARLNQQARRLAVLEERQRIGMDLHDGIIQSIYAVGLSLDYVKHLFGDDNHRAEARINEAISGLNSVIRDLRSYILDLQPTRISEDGLSPALAKLGKEFKANTLMELDLQLESGIAEEVTRDSAMVVFHIAREALANVAKHAHATRTWLSLRQVGDEILLQVIDNGRGFDFAGTDSHIGHGLSNMQDRAATVGGEVNVVTKPNDGTTITLRIPADGTF